MQPTLDQLSEMIKTETYASMTFYLSFFLCGQNDKSSFLQDEKRKMVASAFGEDNSGGSAARLTVEDLRYLFMV